MLRILAVVLLLSGWNLSQGFALTGTTLAGRLAELVPARERVSARFAAAGLSYPPQAITLAAFKSAHRMEIYARNGRGAWQFVAAYPVLGIGRNPGPKLREGDGRTPEGVYRITHLNPNSRFRVSLRLDYPNACDRARAASEGRIDLGGDIVIHGGSASIGCLAMGDEAAEELFVLAADVGPDNVSAVISPQDFRQEPLRESEGDALPRWLHELYATLAARLAVLPRAEPAHPSGGDPEVGLWVPRIKETSQQRVVEGDRTLGCASAGLKRPPRGGWISPPYFLASSDPRIW